MLVLGKRPYKWQREAIMVDDGRAKLKNEVIARPKQHASSQIRLYSGYPPGTLPGMPKCRITPSFCQLAVSVLCR